MKIQLKKSGGFLYGADPISKEFIKNLKGDSFKCDITKSKQEITDDVRSIAQNRLQHLWYADMEKTTVNEHAGNTAEDWKDIMKFEILWDMYVNYNINGFAGAIMPMIKDYTADQMRVVKWELIKAKGNDGNAAWIKTKDLTIEQFTLYLREIERWCHWRGIWLRTDNYLLEMAGLSDGR